MSALAPAMVNSMLANQMNNLALPAVTEKAAASTKIVRKHYYDGHYEGTNHQAQYYGGGGGGKKSKSIALSALTLLAFLFFLHILQTCLQEQMENTNPQILIMQAQIKAAREAEAKEKEAQKRIGQSPEKSTLKDVNSGKIDKVSQTPIKDKYEDEDMYHYQQQVPIKLRYT